MRKSCLKQHRIHSELGIDKRRVAIYTAEELDTFMSLMEVRVVHRESFWTAWASEGPTGCHLDEIKH